MGSGRSAPSVFLSDLGSDYRSPIERGLREVGFFESAPPGCRVFLKPNLTFPTYRPGVMTSVECLTAVTELLVEGGYRVVIGEADSGGYNRFSMDEVFQKTGIRELADRVGAEVVNISFTEPEMVRVKTRWRELRVPVPKLLVREIDAFITLPVPKIHMNTMVSMSLKNQWGCIQDPAERLKLHPYFAEVIHAVCSRLPRAYSIMDGRYGLNGSGPMRGDAVRLDWIMVSNDLVAADRVCCRLMQVDEKRVRYFDRFRREGWWTEFKDIQINESIDRFVKGPFYLKRAWTDWPGLFCFNSSFLAWLGYRSPLAGLLHWLLYLFREPFYDYDAERERVRRKGES